MDSRQLKVVEAYTRDVGRGVARIDYDVMDALEASVGDAIEIRGKRRTVSRAREPAPARLFDIDLPGAEQVFFTRNASGFFRRVRFDLPDCGDRVFFEFGGELSHGGLIQGRMIAVPSSRC